MKQDRIQITSRMPFCKLHKIKHLDKMRLLCPRNNGGAKQGGLLHVSDYQYVVERVPARDLYDVLKSINRNALPNNGNL